jgi:hypothetical protein
MSNMDRPIIVINFQGVIGDFFKPCAFGNPKDQEQSLISNLFIRVGAIQGLKFLAKNF